MTKYTDQLRFAARIAANMPEMTDAEANAYIDELVAQNPNSPLAQLVFVAVSPEETIKLQSRIELPASTWRKLTK